MSKNTKRIIEAIIGVVFITILWVFFLQVTLIGLLLWFASIRFSVATITSIILPLVIFIIFESKKISPKRFLLVSLFLSILIVLIPADSVERATIGLLVLPIVLYLSWKSRQRIFGKAP